MKNLPPSIAACLAIVLASPAHPVQIGPEIRIGGGEATVGGAGVKDGKLAAPSADQVLDTMINSSPLVVLSDADKANIRNAAKTTGYITTVVANPVTSLIIISLLQSDGTERKIPVPVSDEPATGKTWTFSATCLVQQEGGLITAFFSDDPQGLDGINLGDTLQLTSKLCPEYKDQAVSAATVKFNGRSDFPDAQPPLFKHYILGNTI